MVQAGLRSERLGALQGLSGPCLVSTSGAGSTKHRDLPFLGLDLSAPLVVVGDLACQPVTRLSLAPVSLSGEPPSWPGLPSLCDYSMTHWCAVASTGGRGMQ